MKAPKHAGLVETPERDLRISARGQNIEEKAVGIRIGAHLLGDEIERTRDVAQGMGMDIHALGIGDMEDADQIDRIVAKDIELGIEAAILDIEILGAGARLEEAGQQAGQRGLVLLVLLFQRGAEDAGEIADILGHQKVGAHELLDRLARVVAEKTEALRQIRLHIEAQPFLGAADGVMQMAAHIPEEGFGLLERLVFVMGEDVVLDEIGRILDVIDIFADPVERLQIAQTALAFLDVGLDQIAAFALARMALVALGQLGLDEILPGAGRNLGPEARAHILVEIFIAPQKARFEQRRADRHVLFGEAHAFGQRARGMADLQPQIPQHVEDEFDDALAPGRLLERAHEQKVDIRARRQKAAAIAAGRHHGQLLGHGRVLGVIEMLGREIVDHLDGDILQVGERARGDQAGDRSGLGPLLHLIAGGQEAALDQRPAPLCAICPDRFRRGRARSDRGAARRHRTNPCGRVVRSPKSVLKIAASKSRC